MSLSGPLELYVALERSGRLPNEISSLSLVNRASVKGLKYLLLCYNFLHKKDSQDSIMVFRLENDRCRRAFNCTR